MVPRPTLIGLLAAFVAAAAVAGLLPLFGDLLWHPAIRHSPLSQPERTLGGIRDLLFCGALQLAYFMWLQRRTVTFILCLTCIAIGGLTLLLPLLAKGTHLYPNPVFDTMAWSLRTAFPWF